MQPSKYLSTASLAEHHERGRLAANDSEGTYYGPGGVQTGQSVINKTCVKPCAKSCCSRLKSLATIAVIANCTRNDHSTNSSKYFAYSRFYDFSFRS